MSSAIARLCDSRCTVLAIIAHLQSRLFDPLATVPVRITRFEFHALELRLHLRDRLLQRNLHFGQSRHRHP